MFKLRDYQEDAVNACMDYLQSKSNKPGVVVAPTAAGKSWIIAEVAKRYPDKILVLQPSVELLKQNHDKFSQLGSDASLYSDSVGSKEIGDTTYAILPSVKKIARAFKEKGVKLVIIDECHYKISPEEGSMFSIFIKALNPDKVIGLTATPFRLKSNRGGNRLAIITRIRPGYFKHFIHVTQIKEMIDRGFWSPSVDEEWSMDEDRLVLNSKGTEFTDKSIEDAIKVNGINNKIFLRIRDIQSQKIRKSILVFADSLETCEKFCEHIPNSAALSGDTPTKKRAKIIEDFKSGAIHVLFNYGVLTTGFDHPELDCIIVGRPTNSLALFYQIYGRGVRISDNKKDFLFIDYCNNLKRLGHPRDLTIEDFTGHGWSLFCKERLVSKVYLEGPIITKADLLLQNQDIDLETIVPFGKHKGKKLDMICRTRPGYINFLLEQPWLGTEFAEKCRAMIKYVQISDVKPSKVAKEVPATLVVSDPNKPYRGPLAY